MGAVGNSGPIGTMGTIENGKTSLRTLMKVEKYLLEQWEVYELWGIGTMWTVEYGKTSLMKAEIYL